MAGKWPPESKIAVSLTYDGGWPCHFAAAEQLEARGWKGTFYLEATRLLGRILDWKRLSERGHELANHALYDVIDESGLLAAMPANAYQDEVGELKALLEELGLPEHSCAYPLPPYRLEDGIPYLEAIVQKTVVRLNEELMRPAVRDLYSVARGPKIGLNPIQLGSREHQRSRFLHFDPVDLRCYPAGALSTRALSNLLDQATRERAWLILAFSTERNRWWSDEHHEALLSTLEDHNAWVAPVIEVASSLKAGAIVA